jgi:hypothetical protein
VTAGLLAGEGKMVCEGALADGWKFDDVVGLGRRVCDCARGWERGVDAGRRAEVVKVEELERVEEGWTGPSCERRALKAKSGSEASFVVLEVLVWGGIREGYFRTVLLAVRAALEVEEPILEDMVSLQ